MSSVASVEIYALFGGTKLTQNLRAGDQIQFKRLGSQVRNTPVYSGRKEDMSVSSTLQHCVASKRDYVEMAGAQGECNTP